MLEHANRGEVADQYPGGVTARNAAIEAGAQRSLTEIANDLRAATWLLESTWVSTTAEGWQGQGRLSSGALIPVREVVFRRWREVEVHHADLGGVFTWSEWSPAYVRIDLEHQTMAWTSRRPMGLATLPDAALRLEPADDSKSMACPNRIRYDDVTHRSRNGCCSAGNPCRACGGCECTRGVDWHRTGGGCGVGCFS